MQKSNTQNATLKKRTAKRTITPNPLFVKVIRPIIHIILKHRYNLEIEDKVGLKDIKPPYIVVGNHVNYWDPFFLGSFLHQDIQFIASDSVFRTRIFQILMKLLGSIPTSKFITDTTTVAQIIRIVKRGGVIGVFPEGNSTWDGRSLRHVPTVSRLIHKLKLPVIGVVVRGGYLSKPRWARGLRRGKVFLEYKTVFTSEELREIDGETCRRILEERIEHNELEWNRTQRIRFFGKHPAEYIERVLFVCPHCKAIASFYSQGDTAECRECGYSFRYDEYGILQPVNGPLVYTSISEWNDWQIKYFIEYLSRDMNTTTPLFEEGPAILWRGYRSEPLKRLNTGRAYFYPSGIEFHTTVGKTKYFPIEEIFGENVQNKEKLEFYHKNSLYRLDFLNLRASAYMWYQAISLLHQKAQNIEIDGRAHVN
ncbi:MAG: lysophospholipid acyltransferase family protein [Spirochaetia bacterium]|nr:lysophospholipid acyltransferase family protein [Spirochaetia bacterium]